MSGHSKWSKIKRQKGIEDQKRGAEFSKLSRAITIAVMQGKGGDESKNSSLRLAIEKAKQANMPKINIKRAIEKALSKGDGKGMERVQYEGYGPGGVAMIVEVETDNRQRSGAEIKSIFERNGGSMSSPGSAMFMFETKNGSLSPKSLIPLSESDKSSLMGIVEKFNENDDVVKVFHNG